MVKKAMSSGISRQPCTFWKWRSGTSGPAPTQRSLWSPPRQRFTLRHTVFTVENADLITLVLARVRRRSRGSRLGFCSYFSDALGAGEREELQEESDER